MPTRYSKRLLQPRLKAQRQGDYSLQRCKAVFFAGLPDCYTLRSARKVMGIGGLHE